MVAAAAGALVLLGAFGLYRLTSTSRSSATKVAAATLAPRTSVAASSSPASTPTATAMALPPFQAGVTIVVYGNDPGLATRTQAMLDRLKALHVNSVSLAFPFFQAGWTASSVRTDPQQTPSMAYIVSFTREAHNRGMAVLLRPLLDEISLHPSHWRGTIQPANRDQWFQSYTSLLRTYGQAAGAEGVDVLDIGTEFVSLQGDTPLWLALIQSVREVYHGKLTYSANWDSAYPAFGQALDFAGVDAFFPLTAPTGASVNQLASAWQSWKAHLSDISRTTGRPVVLTELGVTAQAGSYQRPYQWSYGTAFSPESQRRYYAASCQALKSTVSGMYWWAFDFYTRTLPLSLDPGYNPMDKPAEQEIGRCFA